MKNVGELPIIRDDAEFRSAPALWSETDSRMVDDDDERCEEFSIAHFRCRFLEVEVVIGGANRPSTERGTV